MMISTRGRYALRVLADIAEHTDKKYVPMKEVAQRQGISLKYLERILPVLTQHGYIEGVQGKGGGYRLIKEPKEQAWVYFKADRGRSGTGCLPWKRRRTL